jgi:hypothetical protein
MVQSLAIPPKNFLKAPGRSGNSDGPGHEVSHRAPRGSLQICELTKPEDTLIRYLSPSTDHVSHMALGKLIIAQVDGGHPFLLQGSDDLADLLGSGLGGDGG